MVFHPFVHPLVQAASVLGSCLRRGNSVIQDLGSVTQLCLALSDPLDYSMPGFPVLHCLPEIAQTHVHWVGDATQQSRSLSPSSPSALNLSQDHRLFQLSQLFLSGGQSAGASASVLSLNIQGWFSVGWTSLISLLSKRLWRVFFSTTVWKH